MWRIYKSFQEIRFPPYLGVFSKNGFWKCNSFCVRLCENCDNPVLVQNLVLRRNCSKAGKYTFFLQGIVLGLVVLVVCILKFLLHEFFCRIVSLGIVNCNAAIQCSFEKLHFGMFGKKHAFLIWYVWHFSNELYRFVFEIQIALACVCFEVIFFMKSICWIVTIHCFTWILVNRFAF